MAAPQQSEPHHPLSVDKADHFIPVSLSTKVRQATGQAMCSAKHCIFPQHLLQTVVGMWIHSGQLDVSSCQCGQE